MNKNIEKAIELFTTLPELIKWSNQNLFSKYKIPVEDFKLARKYRKLKDHPALIEHCEEKGINPIDVQSFWHKSKKFSLSVKPSPSESMESLQETLIEEMKNHSPTYPYLRRVQSKDPHLLIIDPADIHLGKLGSSFEVGEDYNNQIAIQRVREGVQGLLNKSAGFNIEKILLIVGNDILHIDSPKRQTTAGTPQDTDGMWFDNFLLAKKLYVDIIEMLVPLADVHVQYDPSNHDYTNGFFLANTLEAWFRLNKNVTFNVSPKQRKYFVYGENLIGTTHGDGAKEHDLPLLMAQEAPKDWGNCKHRYVYTHHIHHKKSRDYGSVCVESLRSPSGTDSWHAKNGYQHSPKAVEAFVHHPTHGQIARITHLF